MSTKRPKHLDNHFLWWYNKKKEQLKGICYVYSYKGPQQQYCHGAG